MPTGGPIFVIGAEGSGSGLLRLALDRHARIAIAPETGFMRAATAHRFIPFWAFGGRWHRRLGLTDEALTAQLRDFYGGLFRGYAERAGAERWGEATPWHLWHVEALATLFPDAVFAATVRHPAGAVVSRVRRRDEAFMPALKAYVNATAEVVRQAARLGERAALVRYEDLVLAPEATTRALLGWLGESADGVEEGVAGLDPERVSAWEPRVGEWRAKRLRERAGSLAELLGYDLAEPRPAVEWDHGVLTGTDLGARLGDGRLLPPSDPPLAERVLSPREIELRPVAPTSVLTVPPPPPRRSALRRTAGRLRRRLRARLRRRG